MLGNRGPGTGLFGDSLNQGMFGRRIGVERINTYYRFDSGFFDHVDQMYHVFAAFFEQAQVFLGIFVRQRTARYNGRSTTMHLERAHGSYQDRYIGFESAQAAFNVPEFLEADISSKTGLCNMIIEAFQADAVGNDGGLADGNVGKRAGMYEARLAFNGCAQGRINRITHPGGHSAVHFQVTGGYRLALFVVGNYDMFEPFPHVGQIFGNSQDCH
nr:hypothetical protein SPACI_55680 [Sporomusa acidovorans DSM 3132]